MRNWTKIVVKRPKMFHFMTIRISSFSPKLDSPAALKLIDKQIQDENTYESAFIHSFEFMEFSLFRTDAIG